MPGYQSTLVDVVGDGTAVTGTSETSLLTSAAAVGKYIFPANGTSLYGSMPGKRYALRSSGRISNIVTTPGTLTLRLKLGTVIVSASSAMQLNAVAKTNVGWWLDLSLVVRSVGSGTSATIFGQGTWTSESVVGSPVPGSGGQGSLMWQPSAPAVGTGYDSTAAQQVDFTAQFSLTGNSIQVHTFALEDLTTVP